MISVCIATYNGELFIKEQLQSILPQLSAEDEVIVSDDGSTDGTLNAVRSIGDHRIKIVHHEKRKAKFTIDYATANFENALHHAKGDLIFLSDQDDVWCSEKVAVMVKTMQTSDMVMSDCTVVDTQLNIIHKSYYSTMRVFKANLTYNIMKPAFLGSCMAFRRSVLQRALPFPPYGVGHDLWLGLIGLRFYKFKYIPQPLMCYRRHDYTVTDGGKANTTSLWFKISYRLYIIKAVISKILF